MVRYLGSRIHDRQQADLNRLSSVRSRIEGLAEELSENQKRLAELSAQATAASEAIQTKLELAQHELEDAEAEYHGIKAEFEAEQKRKRDAELARIRASANPATRGLPATATEGFQCPVQGGAAFIDSWGFPRSGGRTHKGVDMFAKRGTRTPAVTSGTVKMRTVNLGGIVAYLYGDDGNKYYYAHLNGYPDDLRDGQRVQRGQAIGFVGNTGNAEGTSPHLHFEIRPGGGSAVNPYPTVRPAC
jgi:murein DD-endopeptidase MepM/ murein hydrolase activator NlpD